MMMQRHIYLWRCEMVQTRVLKNRIVLIGKSDVDDFMYEKGLHIDVGEVNYISCNAMRYMLENYSGCKFYNGNRIFQKVYQQMGGK